MPRPKKPILTPDQTEFVRRVSQEVGVSLGMVFLAMNRDRSDPAINRAVIKALFDNEANLKKALKETAVKESAVCMAEALQKATDRKRR